MKTHDNSETAFGHELSRLINRFRDEFDLSYAAAIGALYLRAHELADELEKMEQQENEGEE